MNGKRFQKVLEMMEKRHISQIVVTSAAGVYYLTGVWVDPLERMLALYLDTSGRCVLFGNRLFALPEIEGVKIVLHGDEDDPVEGLAETVNTGTIGIDELWPSRFLIGLMNLRRDLRPVLGSGPLQETRMIKDETELAALRKASRINDSVMERVIAQVRPDLRENELGAFIANQFRENGAEDLGFQMASFGANTADPHHHSDHTVLQRGDNVLFDIGCSFGRYFCDMTRTLFWGGVTDEQKRIYDIVLRANLAGIAAVRPGAPLARFDLAARRVIEDAGYGEFFTHRLGHGIGIECHEAPFVTAVSGQDAQPGMVFSIEPGIYLPGQFGVRIEDLVAVTENGCEVLNQLPKELRVIGC